MIRTRLGRATLSAVAVALATSAATAAAAGFTGATVPRQNDTVNRNRVTKVKVSCPSTASGSCVGKLTLKSSNKVHGHILTLGSSNFTIAAGQTQPVKVKVSKTAANMVKHGKIKSNAIASSHDGSGGSNVTNETKITLKKASGNTQGAPQGSLY
jgi:hypothetical protein